MSQVTDRTVGANPTGFDMRTELNNIIGALETCNSGTSEPLNTVQFMYWFDTSNATYYYLKQRNHNNTAWNTILRYTVSSKIVELVSNGVVINDSNLVHKTGDETKAGVLTLTDGLKLQNQNVSPFSGFKNYIINGKKSINQRGTTSTDNSYNHDRWYKAGNNWFQGIKGDNNLINGKTYTLSWAGVATASYYVGTATSATINAQSFTSVANGGKFILTISAGQNLWIKFSSDATGSTFNYVQLEEGSVATPFEQRPYGLELSLCQMYLPLKIQAGYYGSYGSGYVAIGSTTGATITIPFATTPISLVSSLLTYGNFELVNGNTAFTVTSFSIDTNNTDSRVLSLGVTCSGGGLTWGSACTLRSANSNSSYILVSNEL